MKLLLPLSCALLALASASNAPASDDAPITADALWGSKPKDIEYTGLKHIKGSKRIMVPTTHVMLMTWGKITSVTQTSTLQMLSGHSNNTARSTTEVAAPFEPEVAREIATELYNDLVAKLRIAGWEVLVYENIKSRPDVAGVSQHAIDPKVGAVIDTISVGKEKTRYIKVAPPGLPVISYGMTMPMWGLRKSIKDLDAHSLLVTYRFDPVSMSADGRHGILSNTAATNAKAILELAHADAAVVSAKLGPASIRTKNSRPIAFNVGILKSAKDVSPEWNNVLSKVLSDTFVGVGAISAKKQILVIEPDVAAIKFGAIAGGKAFNDMIVRGLAPQLTAK